MTTPDTLRRALADNASATSAAERADTKTREAAEARLDAVNRRLGEINGNVVINDATEDEYLNLIRERGELQLVLGRGGDE